MTLVRIDNRLIHGQIIETWLPYVRATDLVVVNDELAADVLQQEIMSLAIPQSVRCVFWYVTEVVNEIDRLAAMGKKGRLLILFSNCSDAKRVYDLGFTFPTLNVGNIHYTPGRHQISPSVALSDEDEGCLRYLSKQGVGLDFRCVPNDPVQVRF